MQYDDCLLQGCPIESITRALFPANDLSVARERLSFEIQKQLGYRYVIREMKFIAEKMLLELRIDNVGWGGSHISRPLYLVSNGQRFMKIADLADFHPGSINIIRVSLPQVVEIKNGLSLETDDRVQFSNKTGNFLVRYPVISQ